MLLDKEALARSSQIDPSILQANPQPPLSWANDWRSGRAILSSTEQQGLELIGPPEAYIVEEYKDIPTRDGSQISIKVHGPAETPASGSPLVVVFFGGGFVAGSMDQGSAAARAWVILFDATVVCPNYRLAPEHKFPTSQNDGWDAVEWLDEHAQEVGADPQKGFIIEGTSAGAVTTAAITTHAIEHPLQHPITGQYLFSVPEKYKPYYLCHAQNKAAHILSEASLTAFANLTEWDAKSHWRHPIYSKAPLSKQPPAFFQIDGMDTLRDEELIWEEMLKEAGVKTRIDFYPGCPHGHFPFFPGIEVSIKGCADRMIGMGWLLGNTTTAEEALAADGPRPAS